MAPLALVGSFELLMLLIRAQRLNDSEGPNLVSPDPPAPALEQSEPPAVPPALSLEQTVRQWRNAGHSQRAMARDLNIDRRKVKQIIDRDNAA